MNLSETGKFLAAQEALRSLKASIGMTNDVRAIAELLLYAAEASLPERLFPYVGQPLDKRDQAVVAAFTEELQRLLAGEDEDMESI